MKKVKMNVSISSAEGWSYYAGQEVVIDDDLASKWEEVGHCGIIGDVEVVAVSPATEPITNKQSANIQPDVDTQMTDPTATDTQPEALTTEVAVETTTATKKRGA